MGTQPYTLPDSTQTDFTDPAQPNLAPFPTILHPPNLKLGWSCIPNSKQRNPP